MAGGGAPVPEGGGGKKPVDFQINLIPCIDLLSVLISFLLMTSVWTQIAKIDVKQKPSTRAPLSRLAGNRSNPAVRIKYGMSSEFVNTMSILA